MHFSWWNVALLCGFFVMLLAPSAITLIGRKREDEYATLEPDLDQMPLALPPAAAAEAPQPEVAAMPVVAAKSDAAVPIPTPPTPVIPVAPVSVASTPAPAVPPPVHGPEWVTVRAVEPPRRPFRDPVEEAEEEARITARIAAQANAAAAHAAARAALARAVAAEEIAEVARLEAEAASMAAVSAREKWTKSEAPQNASVAESNPSLDFPKPNNQHRAA